MWTGCHRQLAIHDACPKSQFKQNQVETVETTNCFGLFPAFPKFHTSHRDFFYMQQQKICTPHATNWHAKHKNMQKICKNVQKIFKGCAESMLNIRNICMTCNKYAINMLNMQRKYAKNMQEICKRNIQNMQHM